LRRSERTNRTDQTPPIMAGARPIVTRKSPSSMLTVDVMAPTTIKTSPTANSTSVRILWRMRLVFRERHIGDSARGYVVATLGAIG
jgi:hypothetical protein